MTGLPKPERTDKHDKTNCIGCDYMEDGGLCRFSEVTSRSRLAVGNELFPEDGGGTLFPTGGCNLKTVNGKSKREWVKKKNEKACRRESGHEAKPEGSHGRLTEGQLETMLNLYVDGYSDPAIAKEVGIATKTVYSWRRRHWLKANVPHVGRRK